MNSIANKQVICDTLLQLAQQDSAIVVLCSDSRGSGSMAPFANAFPQQFIEVGIAEQNIVTLAAGLASCGKKPFCVSPACFLSSRSYEQAKVDMAYSNFPVTLVGISGGVSYGALGGTHHSLQDIAAFSAIPGLAVYLPSDQYRTQTLIQSLVRNPHPAYLRVGRNAVPDLYTATTVPADNTAHQLTQGDDLVLFATGEMVYHTLQAAEQLRNEGIKATVVDICQVSPLSASEILPYCDSAKAVLTVEEHYSSGGLGSHIAQILGESHPLPIRTLAFPPEFVISGTSLEVFAYYGLDSSGIATSAREILAYA